MKNASTYDDDEPVADERLRRQLREAFTYVMGDKRGRRFVRWVLAVSGEDRSISCDNALRLSRLSGMRDVGVAVRAAVEAAAPGNFDLLVKEERDERRDLASIRAAERDD